MIDDDVTLAAVCQLAKPFASLVNTFPAPGDPPLILIVPDTSRLACGFVMPIPT